jgi:hypothetical protein
MSGTVAGEQTLHSGGLRREMTVVVSKAAIMAFFILRFKTGSGLKTGAVYSRHGL